MRHRRHWHRRSPLWFLASWSTRAFLVSFAVGGPWPRAALASPNQRLVVDVSPDVASLVDAHMTERLVALETEDVDVPAPPSVSFRPPLYFRIAPASPTSFRVELWELGAPYGARNVSSAGSDNLRARRIALAAAELARQLRRRRLVEIATRSHAPEESVRSRVVSGTPIYARFTWAAGVRAASIGAGDAWFVGPLIDATLRWSSGQRLSLGAAWLGGETTGPSAHSGARWLEANLGFAQGFAMNKSLEVDAGLAASAASVRFDAAGGPGPVDAWSARAGAFGRVEQRLGKFLALSFGPDLGAILRPVSASDRNGAVRRIQGLWLGGTVVLSVDPGAP